MRGRKELEKYLRGEKLGLPGMIRAKCYDCMGGYADGRMDCGISECPLYPRMPYRQDKLPQKARKKREITN